MRFGLVGSMRMDCSKPVPPIPLIIGCPKVGALAGSGTLALGGWKELFLKPTRADCVPCSRSSFNAASVRGPFGGGPPLKETKLKITDRALNQQKDIAKDTRRFEIGFFGMITCRQRCNLGSAF